MRMPNIRRSQIITTYGPGAMIPVDDESFMVAGLDYWFDSAEPSGVNLIHESRLESHLNVQAFALPPTNTENPKGHDIPVVRFPKMYSCHDCRKIDFYSRMVNQNNQTSRCCGSKLITSRFVSVCEAGHVEDFPYRRWAHSKSQDCQSSLNEIRFTSLGQSAGLADLIISCSCGARRSMEGALGKNALQGVTKCFGSQPWLETSDLPCEEQPRASQRGAANIWQAVTASSISIPPWSNRANKFIDEHWASLRYIPEGIVEDVLVQMLENFKLPGGLDEALAALRGRHGLVNRTALSEVEMRSQEHDALIRPTIDMNDSMEFLCVEPDESETIPEGIELVHQVTRLREVRALTGFYRLNGGSNSDSKEANISKHRKFWLPAIEVRGEGLFIELDNSKLQKWEKGSGIESRVSQVADIYRKLGWPIDGMPTPRRVLLHTFSHLLIDQWSLECGYPAASLRERLYVSSDYCGLLIYTATGDSQGSLGGIVGMAKGGRFENSVVNAVRKASWCSNDPLCIESAATGFESLNRGACHACALLPETSCELRNTLLDRGLVIGTSDGCDGFFENLVA